MEQLEEMKRLTKGDFGSIHGIEELYMIMILISNLIIVLIFQMSEDFFFTR